jgi:hypothetical protein
MGLQEQQPRKQFPLQLTRLELLGVPLDTAV